MADFIIVLLIAFWCGIVIRSQIVRRGKGGKCSGCCSGSCTGCSGCSSAAIDELIRRAKEES